MAAVFSSIEFVGIGAGCDIVFPEGSHRRDASPSRSIDLEEELNPLM